MQKTLASSSSRSVACRRGAASSSSSSSSRAALVVPRAAAACSSSSAKLAAASAPLRVSSSSSSVVARASTPSATVAPLDSVAPTPKKGEKVKWYAVVANAQFMLHDVQNEAFPEQLRERRRLFGDKGKPLDFFLVCEPAWLDAQFPAEAKKVKRPAVALISTDATWITFMKLRLDRVLRVDPPSEMTPEEALRCGAPVPEFAPLDRSPEGPGKWTAPYSPYKPGWWDVFLGSENGLV